jgi:hypothetical protein
MITPKEGHSRELLERIADDYRRRGYNVVVEPKGNDLPRFLSGATPDIIARGATESLVIELKSSPKDVDPAQVNAIAQRIAKEPGWRFVLMATKPEQTLPGSEVSTLDEKSIRHGLAEASSLLNSGHLEAALMIAWAATEAILRLIVARHELPVDRYDPATLIRSLVSEGYIGEDAFRQLNDAFRLRSALAHGFRPSRKESAAEAKQATQALSRLSQTLLGELSVSA